MAENYLNIDLLLLGKTGHGKSATGNSILNRKVFKSCGSMESVTNRMEIDYGKVGNKIIMVVDVPGVCDTGENKDAGLTHMLDSAIAARPKGYHALLLIYKFGVRYTNEEEDTITFLKDKLGNDFIRNHAIVVLTNGDTFEKEGNCKREFDSWCRKQTGPFGQLLEECSYRAVVFDNYTKDESNSQAQRQALLDIIENKLAGKRYSHSLFQLAQTIQESVLRDKKPKVTEEMLKTCSLILQDVEDIVTKPETEHSEKDLEQLLSQTAKLQKSAEEKDNRTGELQDMIQMTTLMTQFITQEKDEIKSSKKSRSSKSRNSSIGELVKNIRPSKFEAFTKSGLQTTFQHLKNNYQTNVIQNIVQTLHERN